MSFVKRLPDPEFVKRCSTISRSLQAVKIDSSDYPNVCSECVSYRFGNDNCIHLDDLQDPDTSVCELFKEWERF